MSIMPQIHATDLQATLKSPFHPLPHSRPSTQRIDELAKSIYQAVSDGDLETLTHATDELSQLPLPPTLFQFPSGPPSVKAEQNLLKAIQLCLSDDLHTYLQSLSSVDMIIRTLMESRHAYASNAPRDSETEYLVLTGLRFRQDIPAVTRIRCRSVVDRYQELDPSDHRSIGNLCYEARSLARSVSSIPRDNEEKLALRSVAEMLLIMGFSGVGGHIALADTHETLDSLIYRTKLPRNENKVAARLTASEWVEVDISPDWKSADATPVTYLSRVSRLEAEFLADRHLARLLAERLRTQIKSIQNSTIAPPSTHEKIIALDELNANRVHAKIKQSNLAHPRHPDMLNSPGF
jgi:hypothetical protein